jgi:hypothetical protein
MFAFSVLLLEIMKSLKCRENKSVTAPDVLRLVDIPNLLMLLFDPSPPKRVTNATGDMSSLGYGIYCYQFTWICGHGKEFKINYVNSVTI